MTTQPHGAIVGIANLAACFARGVDPGQASAYRRFPWLRGHEHVEGPFCWVLTECRRFPEPIPYRGAQGLFDVPREVVEKQLDQSV